MHRSYRCLAFLGTLLFAATTASVCPASEVGHLGLAPTHPGERADYELAFDGKFGQPQDDIADAHFSIALGRGADANVDVRGPKPGTATGVVGQDGTISVDAHSRVSDLVIDYNSVVAIAHDAPADLTAGNTWHAVLPVRTSPKSWANVPVDVTVLSSDAAGTTISATGSKDDILFYNGFTMPVTVSAKLDAVFDKAKHFIRADFSDREVVQNLSVSYTWRLSPESAPK